MRSSSIVKCKSFCIINISWYYFKEDEYIKQKISAEEDVTTGAKYIRIMTNNEDVYQQFK